MDNDDLKRIDRLLNLSGRRIATIFRNSIFALQDDLDLKELQTLIARRDFEGALDLVRGVADKLGAASDVAFIDAGKDTVSFLQDAGVGVLSFDQVNQRAVDIMRNNKLRLIEEFTDSQRQAVRQVMVDTIARGLPPLEQARQFREVVGLTTKQTKSVANFRRLLGANEGLPDREIFTRALRDQRSDGAILSAINNNRPLSKKQIDSMVERYAKRFVAHRAKVIARTESLRSVNQGVEQAYTQAISEGKIDKLDIEQSWLSAGDGRVRDSHSSLNGQIRGWGEVWQGLHGALRYPGDPNAPARETINCRCIVTRRIKPDRQAQLQLES